MYRLRIESYLLLGAALVTGCSDRNTPTDPSAHPLASAAALVDRPYTWSFKCNGHWQVWAGWSWTENGTVIVSGSAGCLGDGQVGGTGVRPANANGFTANIGDNSKSWTFDPAGPFKASLSGSVGGQSGHGGGCFTGCFPKENGQLSVDS